MGGVSSTEKKNIIIDKINNIYTNFSQIFNTKDEFLQAIEQSFEENEKEYLNDKTLNKFYDSQANKFWGKIESDRAKELKIEKEAKEKYQNIYEKLLSVHMEEIMENQKSKEFYKKKKEENELILEQIVKDFSDKINNIEKKAEEEKVKMENFKKIMEEEYKTNIEKIKKKLQDEKDEEKNEELEKEMMELEEKKIKKNELNKSYKAQVEDFKSQKFKEYEKEFKNKEEEFCKEDISKYDQNKINIFIKDFLKSEKVPKFIVNYLIKLVELYKTSIKKIEHLNIILIGPSGVGKSTLINSVLGVDSKTGFGLPQTQNIESFESDNVPFLRLIDTRGIEKKNSAGVDKIFLEIKEYIKSQIKTKNFDKFIHVIWYCWAGTRLEESEIQLLQNLSKQYTLETLPVIIVYTNAVFQEEIEKAKTFVKKKLNLNNEFIDVLALEKKIDNKIIKAKNIDILREKSIVLAKSAVKSSIFEGLIDDISDKIDLIITNMTAELKVKIKAEAKNYIENMDEKSSILDLREKTKTIILNVLYKYFVMTPDDDIKFDKEVKIQCGDVQFSFSEKSLELLDSYIINYFQEVLNIYEKNLIKFLTKYTGNLTQCIGLFTVQFNQKNDNLLTDFSTNIEMEPILQNELKEKLMKTAELTALKNSFVFIIEPLIDKIGEYFIEIYKQGMKQQKFIEYIRDSVKVSFDEIEEKIKEYNEIIKQKEDEKQDNNDPAPLKKENDPNHSAVETDVNDMWDDQ